VGEQSIVTPSPRNNFIDLIDRRATVTVSSRLWQNDSLLDALEENFGGSGKKFAIVLLPTLPSPRASPSHVGQHLSSGPLHLEQS
jgi:hypothetical protein